MERNRSYLLACTMLITSLVAHAQSDVSAIRPTSRVFLLPTANAIGAGKGFLSDYELFVLYGGVGIGDMVSLTAGSSIVPGLAFSQQIMTAQLKVTFVQEDGFALAAGGSLSFVTSVNRFTHLFVNSSLLLDSAWYTLAMYLKTGGPDFPSVDLHPFGNFAFSYTGTLGIALGAELPVHNRPDMHIVAELWNHDVSNPRHTTILAGIRIGNDMLSGAFGLAFTPIPFIFPVASFAYEW